LVSKLTGFVVPPNKAIVGLNAFRHEAGIHQDGILKKRTTYEIIRPEDVGYSGTHLILGRHSGRHAFSVRLKNLGFNLNRKELKRAFERFKWLADKKREVFDEDLAAIIEDEIRIIPEIWQLDYLKITSATNTIPQATVRLKSKGKILEAASSGDGPVDASYRAIDKITKIKGALLDYSLRAVTSGKDALGEVSVKIKAKGKEVSGRGASTDIIEASAKAYVNAINKLCQH
jgi:2-isopropylmalate synthase